MTEFVLLSQERALHRWREWAAAMVKRGSGGWSYAVGAGHVSWEVSAHFPGGGACVLPVHHGAQNMLNGL